MHMRICEFDMKFANIANNNDTYISHNNNNSFGDLTILLLDSVSFWQN